MLVALLGENSFRIDNVIFDLAKVPGDLFWYADGPRPEVPHY
jgi:hypothetical protein